MIKERYRKGQTVKKYIVNMNLVNISIKSITYHA